jgi:hypothetical protein
VRVSSRSAVDQLGRAGAIHRIGEMQGAFPRPTKHGGAGTRRIVWLEIAAVLLVGRWAMADPAPATQELESPASASTDSNRAPEAHGDAEVCAVRGLPEACRALVLGARLGVGLGGLLQSPTPAKSVGLGFELPLGGRFRYHGGVGIHDLGGWYGAILTPFGFGYVLPLGDGPGPRWRLEPAVDLLVVEELFTSTGHAALVGSGAWLRGSLHLGSWLFGLVPIGAHVRYLYMSGSRPDTRGLLGSGVDWTFRVEVGRQFP